ncbi:MAG: putative metal-binding motif-containing protein, partial [Deltaproteobacteria bacterium]|nr:putative metal-binding motif-containing protein [Deltaproteobacteria bacterium]
MRTLALTLVLAGLVACRAKVVTLQDLDGDGFSTAEDCDDQDASANPSGVERCDGVDNDCDGDVDEDAEDAPSWFPDQDGDGFGDPEGALRACEAPSGYVAAGDDCDDSAPLAWEGAEERCDGVDNDCDGDIDGDAADAPSWFSDQDGDGFGDAAVRSCSAPVGHVATGGDCDDGDAAISPAREERCDGVDEDCDGEVDEGAADGTRYYPDDDGDLYGRADEGLLACAPPAGYAAAPGDCDDSSPEVSPDAPERCNERDDDCDGDVDEDPVNAPTWYLDLDGDGYGGAALVACAQPDLTVRNSGDCDDAEALAWTGAPERCDGVDNDCDGVTDLDAVDKATWYADRDRDGHGDPSATALACVPPEGFTGPNDDCDDTEPLAWTGAPERCDGADNDCDGVTDLDAVDRLTWYADHDGDHHGDPSVTALACAA